VRVEPTSPTLPHRQPASLRLTFDGPLSGWAAAWGRAGPALRGRDVRVAVPLELEDDVARAAAERAIADVLAAGLTVDVVPALAGDRTLTTRSAARVHAALVPALATLPPTVGMFLVCKPPPRALQAALSAGAGGVWTAARRLLDVASGVPATVWAARQGQRDLRELARDLRQRSTVAAAPPPLLPLDSPLSSAALHWLLGCPDVDVDDGPIFGPPAALCFAPLAATDRASQHRAFSLWAARHREKSHAIALGPTSPLPGLPSSATYRAPSHLAQDLAAARALGFSDVTVMGLDGLVLDDEGAVRPDAGAWLEAALGEVGAAAARAA
jgi:hypothetical protein